MKRKIHFKNHEEKFKMGSLTCRIRSIRVKLIIAYSLPIILFISFGIFSYKKASEIIVENYKQANMNMIEKTGDFYKILFQTADSKSQQFSSYSDVRNYYSGLYKNDPKILIQYQFYRHMDN